MKFQKKQDCMKLIFISFGTDLIKLKLWLMVLTVCLIQKETKRRKKDRDKQMNSNAFDLGPNSTGIPDKSVSQRKGSKM